MIDRYEQLCDYDDVNEEEVLNIMHKQSNGDWCKHSDVDEEIIRLKDLIDKMYESRFEPDKLDIYRRKSKS